MLGFELTQTMSGTYHTLAEPGVERPMSITVRARVHDLRKFVLDPTAEIEGEVDAEGLADHRPLRGTLEINPILRGKLIYDFAFPDNAERQCRFHGEQDLEALRLVQTMTTLAGGIFVSEEEHARAVLRFQVRKDLVKLLKSFRPKV
jgi:hypothetical protein